MADSASKSSNEVTETAPDSVMADVKQLESQLVSLNFVLKNTQSEVIKLQKTLARFQTHQEESDKKLAKIEQDVARNLVNQRADEGFRSRFWLYQLGTMLVTLMLAMMLMNLMPRQTVTVAPAGSVTTTTTESGGTGASGNGNN